MADDNNKKLKELSYVELYRIALQAKLGYDTRPLDVLRMVYTIRLLEYKLSMANLELSRTNKTLSLGQMFNKYFLESPKESLCAECGIPGCVTHTTYNT